MHKLKFILISLISLLFICSCNSSDNSSSSGGISNPVVYTVSFEANGGTGLMDSITVFSGESIQLPENIFVRAGFDFAGWAVSESGEAVYSDNENITVNNNITLYAVWSSNDNPVVYTVIFDGNGGSGSMDLQQFNIGETKPLSLNTFSYTGYKFLGWSISPNGNPVYSDGESIECTSDLLLYAVWAKDDTGGSVEPVKEYTIYFNANNGDGYMLPLTVEAGKSIQLSENIYTRAGFVFKGWSKVQDGAVEFQDKQYISVSENTTLYAVWEPMQAYTITYHSNTAVEEVKKVSKYPPLPGDKIYLDANEFTNGDLKFVGWSLNQNDNKVTYQDAGPLFELTSNIDLYAVWESNPVTISFNPNGGTGEMPDLYARPGDVIKIPEPVFTRKGYLLKGAYTYNLVTYGTGMDFKVPDENVTFLTLWVEIPKDPDPVFGGNSDKYIDMDVWVKGVTVNKEDWIESNSPGLFYAVRKSNSGWYDTDQSWLNLCWAGASSNMLHWWHDMNKDNVKKYFDHYAPENAERPDTVYEGWGKSRIFGYFSIKYPNHGYYINRALSWYLIGPDDWQPAGGGFYKEVFGDNFTLVEEYLGVTQYSFNKAMARAFDNDMAIGGSEINMSGSHAITLWGAHFNSEGLIDKIYVSDSATAAGNNSPKGYETGLSVIEVVYDQTFGKVYMKTYLGGQIPLTSVTLLSNGAKEWEEYFNTHQALR